MLRRHRSSTRSVGEKDSGFKAQVAGQDQAGPRSRHWYAASGRCSSESAQVSGPGASERGPANWTGRASPLH